MTSVSREFTRAAYDAANTLRQQLAPEQEILLNAAYDLVLGGDVEASPDDSILGVYSPVERHTYFVTDAESPGSTCTCHDSALGNCVHRLAARLYAQAANAIETPTCAETPVYIEGQSTGEPLPMATPPASSPTITQHSGRLMMEAPFSATVKAQTPKGFCWLITVRGDEAAQFRADLLDTSAWLIRLGCQPILDREAKRQRWEVAQPQAQTEAPLPQEEPPLPASDTAADTVCPVHGVVMMTNERGTAHKVADRKWCDGHWCQLHNERLWKKNGKRGVFYGHNLPDASLCTGKAKSAYP